ncbi:tetratricopeptide repeat protein [Tumidithrix elongata RA019]|uniref:protein O-GlcNAc transferase n=1 Tax=Tumidithrix elongata BACA0141 TaxID=2716417 RepID=A0AAW9PQ22_9CYAN|nr:tetratricopeptide repeat protein [Tumidithrix elongata RA019]
MSDEWMNQLELARLHLSQGQLEEASHLCELCLEANSDFAEAYWLLGDIRNRQGRQSEVMPYKQKALELKPSLIPPETHNHLGIVFIKEKNLDAAIASFKRAIFLKPQYVDAHYNLGNALTEQDLIEQAIGCYETVLEIEPTYINALVNLGTLLTKQGKFDIAIEYLQRTLELQPDCAEVYSNLGSIAYQRGKTIEAIEHYQTSLSIDPTTPEVYFNLGLALFMDGQVEAAIAVCEKSIELDPDSNAYQLFYLALPILYDTVEQIDAWRQRAIWGLEQFSQTIRMKLDTPVASEAEFNKNRQWCLNSILSITNFYLAYQAQNDVEFQYQYGQLIQEIVAARYPQWSWENHRPMPVLKAGEKIRIGYLSAYLCDHAATRLVLNWLRYSDSEQFEIYSYFIGKKPDEVTKEFQQASHCFHHIPDDFAAIADRVTKDNLHILVFTDIGMYPYTTPLAAMRLAPMQCTCWAHPVTSGLSTIDYFLSSERMEPENAETHYTEELIRLPNIAISYPKPILPETLKPRSHFHLSDDAILYFCSQSLYKYLPQHDYIFAEIAKLVPSANFLFLGHKSAYVTQRFCNRLERTFADYGLSFQAHCVFLPSLVKAEYLNVHILSDVFLDSFGWSGGNTTLEAIACDSPVVTCPGDFMRGRHAYGILQMLGVTDTIASTEAEYVEIAVRLGLDLDWRNHILEKMKARHHSLYDDRTCIAALEDFFKQKVNSRNGKGV